MNPQLKAMLQQVTEAFQMGKFEAAESIMREMLQRDINSSDIIFDLGVACAESSKLIEASVVFRSLQLYKKDDVRIPYNLGLILSFQGKYKLALEAFDLALKIQPDEIETLINKGAIYNEIQEYALALEVLDLAIQINQDHHEAHSNKGTTLHELNRYEEAITHYDKALSLKPDYAAGWSNKGNALYALKRYDEAIAHHDKALMLNPEYAEALSNKGISLHALKRYCEAIAHYDNALNLRPDYAEALSNKGNALYELKRYDEAIAQYDNALSLKPDYAEGWANKGIVLTRMAYVLDANMCFEKALALKPDFPKARWAKLFTSIPVIAFGNENLQELREKFSLELEKLSEWLVEKSINEVFELVGSIQPFYLAYQEKNNREIFNQYGTLCCRLMNKWQSLNGLHHNTKKDNGKIKLGIVGEQICNHSVWNAITKGLVFNLEGSQFEIHIFHLGNSTDDETHSAKLKATSFTNDQSSLMGWANSIIEKNIDVLLYPEIGMNPLATQLASLRLAPLQIASWGHPETTGLETIDYYLSAELFENEFSQDAYTENLIKLPNLGCHYSRLPINADKFDLESFGINPDEPILICPGTPYKYAPKNDWIFVEIAKRLGKGKLIFFNYENNLTKILKLRLEKAFNEANLVLGDFVVFIPWLKPEAFYGLMNCSDVYLDTIGFSGFNSAMQAVDCAVPIVAREGSFMRGRFASGILKRMDITELIASNDEAYVDLVIRLVQDKPYNKQIRNRIIKARNILYDDAEPIDAFGNFLLSKVDLSST